MRPNEYKNLEQDKLFKRRYLGKILWWKNFLLIAPSLLIFIGIAGVLYVAQGDSINPYYMIPYAVVFLMGAIWLKAVKKHLQDKILNDKERFLVCASRAIGDTGGYYYFIFSKDSKRHNELLINKLAESMDISSLTAEQISLAKKGITEISTEEEETPVYLIAKSINSVLRTNRENIRTGITPLLYISPKNVFVVRRKDLPK